MTRGPVEFKVPAIVQAKAAVRGRQSWAEAVPQIVAELQRMWSVTLVSMLPGGTASVVARVVTDDGRPAVVKLAAPGTGFAQQVRTLRAADGNGYVRLLAHDSRREAVLMEALDGSLLDSGLSPLEQLVIMARLLRRSWRLPIATVPAAPQDKAAALAEAVSQTWRDLEQPCSRAVVDYALHCAERRSADFTPSNCVVLHGDAAAANAARVPRPRPGDEAGFVLLDPESFVGDRAYDLGVALRDWCPELSAAERPADMLGEYCHVLAQAAEADPVAAWEWGYLERVSTGLYALSLGAAEQGAAQLQTAEAVLADR